MNLIFHELPYILALLIPSITLSNYLAYAVGIEPDWRRESRVDSSSMSVSMFVRSTPYFWQVNSVPVRLLGSAQSHAALQSSIRGRKLAWTIDSLLDYLWHYALPFAVLNLRGFLAKLIYVRNVTVDILDGDFVVIGLAKGSRRST